MTLSLIQMLVWLMWGFCMGIGWTLGCWLINKLLARFG